jgi:PQQ-like domain
MASLLLVVAISAWAGNEESNGAAPPSLSTGNPLTPQWTFSAGAESVIQAVYYSADGAEVVVSSGGSAGQGAQGPSPAQIIAADPATGRVRWTFDTGSEVAESFESVGGVVLAFMGGTLGGAGATGAAQQVWAFSADDGAELWSADLEASELTPIGLSGDLLVEFGAGSVSAVDALSGQPAWTVRVPQGCQVIAGADDDQGIGLLTQCGAALRASGLDPRTGRTRWSDLIDARFIGTAYPTAVSVYGPDTVVWDGQGEGAETLLSADGSALVRTVDAASYGVETDEWAADSAGHLVRLIDGPGGAISVTDYAAATGAVVSNSSLPEASVLAQGSAVEAGGLYALVKLQKPLPTLGLEVAVIGRAHSSLFALPTVGTDLSALAVGPDDVYVDEQGPNDTGEVVALRRPGLAAAAQIPRPYAAHWPQACTLLSSAQLSSATGHAYDGYGVVVHGDGVPGGSTCRYITTSSGEPEFEVDVAWDGTSRTQTTEIFDEVVEGVSEPYANTTTSLPGIGDAAFDVVDYIPLDLEAGDTATVDARVGTVLVAVTELGGVSLAPTVARMVAARVAQEEGS